MSEEVKRIMQMVEEGKVSAEEGTALIEAMKEQDATEDTTTEKTYMNRSVKIRIKEADKERVRLNIPIKFVKWMLKTGHGIASAIPDAKPFIEDIDLDVVMNAIDQHETGKIIDLTTEEGEEIAIYIE